MFLNITFNFLYEPWLQCNIWDSLLRICIASLCVTVPVWYDDELVEYSHACVCACSSFSCANLDKHARHTHDDSDDGNDEHFYSVSAPASTNSLLGNFEVGHLLYFIGGVAKM